jgi:hypothetical protein
VPGVQERQQKGRLAGRHSWWGLISRTPQCDDQRPCARCVARSEMCVPLPARARKNTTTRCEGCRKGNFRCDDVRPCPNCVSAGIECVNPARKGPGCGTRVRAVRVLFASRRYRL